MSVHLWQGGLGLPERDFCFNRENGTALIRREYVAHLARMLKLLGSPGEAATAAAEKVMEFETALAQAWRKLEDLRDPEKNYHKMTAVDLTGNHTPLIDWNRRLDAMSLRPEVVIVGQPEFFTTLNQLLVKTPVPILKDYLRQQLVSIHAEYLGKDREESLRAKLLSDVHAPQKWRVNAPPLEHSRVPGSIWHQTRSSHVAVTGITRESLVRPSIAKRWSIGTSAWPLY